MPAIPVIAAVSAAATVVGTIAQIDASRDARRASKAKFQFDRQIANNNAARERRNAVRAGRITAAQISQGAENTGAGLSSAALGGLGSIRSQINSNLSFLDTNQKLADQSAIQAGKIASAQGRAQLFGQLTSLSSSIFSASGGVGAFGKKGT